MKSTIKIGKRGSGLAFRIPKAIVERFNLKVGDTIDSSIIERALIRSKAEPERNEV
jgi:antitoxin component of MazEF toxin-antitoxin module